MGNASSALTCIWDQALKPCLDPSISRCQAALGGKLSACLFLEGNWRTLDEENTALQTTEVKVKRSIKAEDNKGRDCDEDVAKWQEEVGELEKKFPAIRDDYTNITRCVCGCTPNLCARYSIGQAVYEQLWGVRKLETEAKAFASLAHERLPGAVEDQGKPWTVGLSQTVANLRGFLREEDRRIIGLKSFHLSNFQHMVHLKEISLHSCYELKELIIVKCSDDDDITPQEFNLEVLNLTMLMNFERVLGGVTPNLLQNLQELSIESCPKLESINWILQLAKLQKLSVCDCAGILHLVDNIPEEQKTGLLKPFSKLRSIVLKDLKKLESICPPMTFLSLESIRVQGCLNLSRLPFGAQYYEKTKLPEISGYQEWWKALKWEEKGLEAILRPNFVAI
ncbi:hypothetical protein J5N97_001605 [Dioscorea zingiberensis]|uniref:Disease resistance protein n=1 Tax=Dioscorea zingiberensis TaxID=325984 RepID=A0A9D5BU04_9LILI|nr:hypothetical protein J5N97_001605 [Dioscorea zingiberensis]